MDLRAPPMFLGSIVAPVTRKSSAAQQPRKSGGGSKRSFSHRRSRSASPSLQGGGSQTSPFAYRKASSSSITSPRSLADLPASPASGSRAARKAIADLDLGGDEIPRRSSRPHSTRPVPRTGSALTAPTLSSQIKARQALARRASLSTSQPSMQKEVQMPSPVAASSSRSHPWGVGVSAPPGLKRKSSATSPRSASSPPIRDRVLQAQDGGGGGGRSAAAQEEKKTFSRLERTGNESRSGRGDKTGRVAPPPRRSRSGNQSNRTGRSGSRGGGSDRDVPSGAGSSSDRGLRTTKEFEMQLERVSLEQDEELFSPMNLGTPMDAKSKAAKMGSGSQQQRRRQKERTGARRGTGGAAASGVETPEKSAAATSTQSSRPNTMLRRTSTNSSSSSQDNIRRSSQSDLDVDALRRDRQLLYQMNLAIKKENEELRTSLAAARRTPAGTASSGSPSSAASSKSFDKWKETKKGDGPGKKTSPATPDKPDREPDSPTSPPSANSPQTVSLRKAHAEVKNLRELLKSARAELQGSKVENRRLQGKVKELQRKIEELEKALGDGQSFQAVATYSQVNGMHTSYVGVISPPTPTSPIQAHKSFHATTPSSSSKFMEATAKEQTAAIDALKARSVEFSPNNPHRVARVRSASPTPASAVSGNRQEGKNTLDALQDRPIGSGLAHHRSHASLFRTHDAQGRNIHETSGEEQDRIDYETQFEAEVKQYKNQVAVEERKQRGGSSPREASSPRGGQSGSPSRGAPLLVGAGREPQHRRRT
eukprot:CAMPEP_0118964804 /NCGR_PEP_ID=MMETSP1173-20130426/2420_1 /TAXON_ID=1034831 /ORGANISM="Rhizochromulina marina cf, Strain CCMP1243" /LENGTH=765 /DNA_ID=CAMNT_0006913305 /DNA_START=53 /DNA_END=2347 /DNA_ORIENTATION=-